MDLIADILLVISAGSAAVYCAVLSRRLRRFTDLEKGVGGAIAVLSLQVDDMTKTVKTAQLAAIGSKESLDNLTIRAESAARRLELLVASLHDIPEVESKTPSERSKEILPPKKIEPQFSSQRTRYQEAAE